MVTLLPCSSFAVQAQDVLNLIKQIAADNRFMSPPIVCAVPDKIPIVDGVREYLMNMGLPCQARSTRTTTNRRNLDNVTCPLFSHHWQHCFGHVHNTVEVCVNLRPENNHPEAPYQD
jgi:hypothetical protein